MLPTLTRENLIGVWHALLTPWNDDDTVDLARLRVEVRSFAGTGIHGLYTGGTTGEFYAQNDRTFTDITACVIEHSHAIGLPVQIGCTTLSTRTTCLRIREAVAAGADAVQVALPFWLELADVEVIAFMEDCAAAAAPNPVVLYQTPRSKRKLSVDLLQQVAARIPSLIGAKDTGATPEQVRQIVDGSGLSIFGAEDFYVKLPAGGRGGYCSVTGLNPRAVVRLYHLCCDGRYDEAEPLHNQVHHLVHDVLVPMVSEDGLWDSAIDRIQRMAGGGDVGLRCQKPYRSAPPDRVQRVLEWCRSHAPDLLPESSDGRASSAARG